MIDYILNFLKTTKLTLVQAGLGLLAAFIGYLLLALKLKGSALHKAQVELLQEKVRNTDLADDTNIAKARQAFNDALIEYRKAHK